MLNLFHSKLLILIVLSIFFLFSSCQEETGVPQVACNADTFFADTCVSFELNELEIIEDSIQYSITDNSNFKLDFEMAREAEMALEVIQYYQFNEYCIIGQDTSFAYFLTNSQIPEGEFIGEDCLRHEVCELNVLLTSSGKYTVVEPNSLGNEWLYPSESQDTANQILQTLQYFQSEFGCYVGRPKTKFAYIRR